MQLHIVFEHIPSPHGHILNSDNVSSYIHTDNVKIILTESTLLPLLLPLLSLSFSRRCSWCFRCWTVYMCASLVQNMHITRRTETTAETVPYKHVHSYKSWFLIIKAKVRPLSQNTDVSRYKPVYFHIIWFVAARLLPAALLVSLYFRVLIFCMHILTPKLLYTFSTSLALAHTCTIRIYSYQHAYLRVCVLFEWYSSNCRFSPKHHIRFQYRPEYQKNIF